MLPSKHAAFGFTGIILVVVAIWILIGTSAWIDRPFAGFLLLDNGVVASAGLASWPAAADGEIFQHILSTYDGVQFSTPSKFHEYVRSVPVGNSIDYEFSRGDTTISASISTREFERGDALLLFGATLVCAIAFIGVAIALLAVAPRDPASLGSAVSFGIIGLFALTALDLYGPYRFFRLHAVLECFLGASLFHMALVFPYRRKVATAVPWLIPSGYAFAAALGGTTAVLLYEPEVYILTHRLAIAGAGLSFVAMVVSQVAAFVRPVSYEARQRVSILALGTFASITPGCLVLLASTVSGGGAAENSIGWAGAFFPISVAYAVLRSDALQVDAILRRSASYAILTLFVGASYAAVIGSIEWILRDQENVSRWVSILVFSGVCTFAILPLRDRIQSSVDKIFFRSVYDFRLTIEETSAVLARITDLDKIHDLIRETVIDALQPETVELAVAEEDLTAPPDSDTNTATGEFATVEDLDCGGISIPFRSSNRIVASLHLGRRLSGKFYGGEDRTLLQVLANQGAVAIENALALESLQDLNRTLETRVEDRTAELAKAIQELQETQVQLVQAERLAAVGELAAGVAHEVNNPLNFSRNSLRTLSVLVDEIAEIASRSDKDAQNSSGPSPDSLADDIKELVDITGAGLDRTAKLVADLRDFAKPRSLEAVPYDICDVIRTTLQLTGSTLREAKIDLVTELPNGQTFALGDPSAMSQVLLNLVKNSVDALEGRDAPSIQITVGADDENEQIELTVRDTGSGFGQEVAARVFEPFYTTKVAGKGTGLGLPMCLKAMQECGGSIAINSTPGVGTTVTLSIPAA